MKIKKIAKKLEKMGEKGDTVLAHINPQEADMLMAAGGAGKRNPKTGLLSFYDPGDAGDFSGFAGDVAASNGDPATAGGEYAGGYGNTYGGPNIGFGTAETETRGFTPAEMSSRSALGEFQDFFDSLGLTGQAFVPGGAFLGLGLNWADRNGYGWTSGNPAGRTGSDGATNLGGEAGSGGYGSTNGGGLPSTTPTAPQAGFSPIAQQPFVSKWGKPRTRGYFGS